MKNCKQAIMGYAITLSLAKSFSIKHNYVISPMQEAIALGTSNALGSVFGTIPATSSLSRTSCQVNLCSKNTQLERFTDNQIEPEIKNFRKFILSGIVRWADSSCIIFLCYLGFTLLRFVFKIPTVLSKVRILANNFHH